MREKGKWKVLAVVVALTTLTGCTPPTSQATGSPQPSGVNVSIFQKIYPPPTLPKRLTGIKPKETECPRYIKVWVGSYSDKKGDFHEAHWEWLKISDCKPQTNF